MKTLKMTFAGMSFIENPRSIDRLNTVCSFLLGGMLIVLTYLALQPSMNPRTNGGFISIEIESPAGVYDVPAPVDSSTAESSAATVTEANSVS